MRSTPAVPDGHIDPRGRIDRTGTKALLAIARRWERVASRKDVDKAQRDHAWATMAAAYQEAIDRGEPQAAPRFVAALASAGLTSRALSLADREVLSGRPSPHLVLADAAPNPWERAAALRRAVELEVPGAHFALAEHLAEGIEAAVAATEARNDLDLAMSHLPGHVLEVRALVDEGLRRSRIRPNAPSAVLPEAQAAQEAALRQAAAIAERLGDAQGAEAALFDSMLTALGKYDPATPFGTTGFSSDAPRLWRDAALRWLGSEVALRERIARPDLTDALPLHLLVAAEDAASAVDPDGLQLALLQGQQIVGRVPSAAPAWVRHLARQTDGTGRGAATAIEDGRPLAPATNPERDRTLADEARRIALEAAARGEQGALVPAAEMLDAVGDHAAARAIAEHAVLAGVPGANTTRRRIELAILDAEYRDLPPEEIEAWGRTMLSVGPDPTTQTGLTDGRALLAAAEAIERNRGDLDLVAELERTAIDRWCAQIDHGGTDATEAVAEIAEAVERATVGGRARTLAATAMERLVDDTTTVRRNPALAPSVAALAERCASARAAESQAIAAALALDPDDEAPEAVPDHAITVLRAAWDVVAEAEHPDVAAAAPGIGIDLLQRLQVSGDAAEARRLAPAVIARLDDSERADRARCILGRACADLGDLAASATAFAAMEDGTDAWAETLADDDEAVEIGPPPAPLAVELTQDTFDDDLEPGHRAGRLRSHEDAADTVGTSTIDQDPTPTRGTELPDL